MYDVSKYYGDSKPTWEPKLGAEERQTQSELGRGIQIFRNILSADQCNSLISQFEIVEKYPVGVDGYCNDPENAGSYRAMAWAPELAEMLTHKAFIYLLPEYFDEPLNDTRFKDESDQESRYEYQLLGSTPWLRFMRYENSGMHVPHYDASYHCPQELYRTLYSWVLYLNDVPEEQGGAFQFVDDTQSEHRHDFSDWTRMANPEEIMESIQPERGMILVFPHWLCHQVQRFTSTEQNRYRYLVRGDVAYAM